MTAYKAGSVISYGGGLWYAQTDTSGEPSVDPAWQLMVQGGTGADPDIYRPTGIQAGGTAGSGGATFGIENHGYGANEHSAIYLSEGQLDFTAVDDGNGSNTEWTQDNQQFNYYVTDAAGISHTLLEMGVDSTGAPFARILGAAVGGSPGEQHDFASAGQWTVNHAIGRIPSVTVYDDAGNLLLAEVAATSTQVVITFANPTAGTAVLT